MPNADRILKAYDAGKLKALQDFAATISETERNSYRYLTRDEIVAALNIVMGDHLRKEQKHE